MYPVVQLLQGDIVDRMGALVAEQAERGLLQLARVVQQAVRAAGNEEFGKAVERNGEFDEIVERRFLAIALPGNQH